MVGGGDDRRFRPVAIRELDGVVASAEQPETGPPRLARQQGRRQLPVGAHGEILGPADDLDAHVVGPGVVVSPHPSGDGVHVAPGHHGVY